MVTKGVWADAGDDGKGFELAGADLAVGEDVEGMIHVAALPGRMRTSVANLCTVVKGYPHARLERGARTLLLSL